MNRLKTQLTKALLALFLAIPITTTSQDNTDQTHAKDVKKIVIGAALGYISLHLTDITAVPDPTDPNKVHKLQINGYLETTLQDDSSKRKTIQPISQELPVNIPLQDLATPMINNKFFAPDRNEQTNNIVIDLTEDDENTNTLDPTLNTNIPDKTKAPRHPNIQSILGNDLKNLTDPEPLKIDRQESSGSSDDPFANPPKSDSLNNIFIGVSEDIKPKKKRISIPKINFTVPPEEYDDYGFNKKTKKHKDTNSLYDDENFNYKGIHKTEMTKYNRWGRDIDGKYKEQNLKNAAILILNGFYRNNPFIKELNSNVRDIHTDDLLYIRKYIKTEIKKERSKEVVTYVWGANYINHVLNKELNKRKSRVDVNSLNGGRKYLKN